MHVIFLNSAYAGHIGYIGYVSESSSSNSAEAAWLVSDLKAASAGDDPATIVVVSHYPIVNGKTTKPYAGTQKTEALALQALFATYGVDMVVTGDTHVYRRTMVAVNRSGATFRVPYVQIPPAGSTPRSFGVSPIPALAADEAGWAPSSELSRVRHADPRRRHARAEPCGVEGRRQRRSRAAAPRRRRRTPCRWAAASPTCPKAARWASRPTPDTPVP